MAFFFFFFFELKKKKNFFFFFFVSTLQFKVSSCVCIVRIILLVDYT